MQLTVTTTMISKHTNENMWFTFETAHETLHDVYEDLAEDGVIYGDRIKTARRGGRTVEVSREPHIVGVMGVMTIRDSHIQFDPAPQS